MTKRFNRLDSAFNRAWREEATVDQKGVCRYCRTPITFKTVTSDHVIPRSKGGAHKRKNIVAACQPCNKLKGNMSVAEFSDRMHSPKSGDNIQFYHARSRLRINLRIELFERRLMKAVGKPIRK